MLKVLQHINSNFKSISPPIPTLRRSYEKYIKRIFFIKLNTSMLHAPVFFNELTIFSAIIFGPSSELKYQYQNLHLVIQGEGPLLWL